MSVFVPPDDNREKVKVKDGKHYGPGEIVRIEPNDIWGKCYLVLRYKDKLTEWYTKDEIVFQKEK